MSASGCQLVIQYVVCVVIEYFSGPRKADSLLLCLTFCVSLHKQLLSNEMIFDPDIWHGGSV